MIDLNNVIVKYRGSSSPALSSLSLHIDKGQYVAIMGPNGSGKSTLIKVLCGLVPPSDGQISLLGKEVRPGYFGDGFFGKVGVIFQEPEGQFLMRNVETEIVSVLQNLGLPSRSQRERFDAIVDRFDLADILDKKPENLSGGQMQIVNLGCALVMEPEILLLDEPVTYLDRFYQKVILDQLDIFHKSGKTIMHVTQNTDEAARADRICILDNGRLVADYPSYELLCNPELIKRYDLIPPVGWHFKKLFGFDLDDDAAAKIYCEKLKSEMIPENNNKVIRPSVERICSLRDLKFHYDKTGFAIIVDKLDFFKGEVVGLVGPTGSGKSTLAFLLAGLIKPEAGDIEYRGRPLSSFSIKELRKRIGIAWQLSDLAMLGPTVKDDIEFIIHNLGLDKIDPAAVLRRVGLEGFEDRIVDTLSGGEKRKLSLAGVLTADPELVILDEPTAFLDPRSQMELAAIVRNLAEEGRSIIIAGHDLQFVSNLATRILGIKNGAIILDLPAKEFSSDTRHSIALGLPPDPIIAFRQMLAEQGHLLPFASLEPKPIKEYLDKL
jgi:energy-coupling factor transporter ATP-binding protein EcfA2